MWGSKAISLNFLEILGSPAEHVLPTTLKGCLEKARFIAYVIEAREPNMIRIGSVGLVLDHVCAVIRHSVYVRAFLPPRILPSSVMLESRILRKVRALAFLKLFLTSPFRRFNISVEPCQVLRLKVFIQSIDRVLPSKAPQSVFT